MNKALRLRYLTNTASLFAILYIYRKDIARLAFLIHYWYVKTRQIRYQSDFRFVCFIVIGTIPAGVLGILLSDYIAENVSMTTIAVMLLHHRDCLMVNPQPER